MMLRPRSLRGAPVILAGVSLAMMLLPSAASQKPRLLLLAGLIPLRATSTGAAQFAGRFIPSASASDTEKVKLEHLQGRVQELSARVMDLQGQLETVAGARGILTDPKLILLPADVVVNADSNAWRRSMVLSRGSSHGVSRGMLVLWQRHLIGRIIEVSPWTCRVLLVTDSGFRIGGLALPKAYDESVPLANRDKGVIEGTGDRTAALKWIQGDALLETGATVVTIADPATGVPRGLLIGKVTSVSRGSGLYPKVEVLPFVNAKSLDSVAIVLKADK